MKTFILFLSVPLLLWSCGSSKEFKRVVESYESDYDYKKDADIFRNSDSGSKLRGNVILIDHGYFDSTIVFKTYATFEKGIQQNEEKVYRNDTLIHARNYLNGKKHGEQKHYWRNEMTISNFENGIKHGEEIEMEGDQIVRKSNFTMGIKSSTEYRYDSLGNLENTLKYELDSGYWNIPVRSLKMTEIQYLKDSVVSAYDYVSQYGMQFMGEINIFPEHNTWIWPEDIIHRSELENDCDECQIGRFYIISLWGGDGFDQVWTEEWLAYSTFFGLRYEFVWLERP